MKELALVKHQQLHGYHEMLVIFSIKCEEQGAVGKEGHEVWASERHFWAVWGFAKVGGSAGIQRGENVAIWAGSV